MAPLGDPLGLPREGLMLGLELRNIRGELGLAGGQTTSNIHFKGGNPGGPLFQPGGAAESSLSRSHNASWAVPKSSWGEGGLSS